jgi:hypothetical protein
MQLYFNLNFEIKKNGQKTFEQMTHGNISTDLPQCINKLHVLMLMGFCFCSWRLKGLVFAFRKVEGFYFCSWTLKGLVFTFEKVEGFCFFSWRLKGLVLIFKEVEGFCFCSWTLKVFALRGVEGFCF